MKPQGGDHVGDMDHIAAEITQHLNHYPRTLMDLVGRMLTVDPGQRLVWPVRTDTLVMCCNIYALVITHLSVSKILCTMQ